MSFQIYEQPQTVFITHKKPYRILDKDENEGKQVTNKLGLSIFNKMIKLAYKIRG